MHPGDGDNLGTPEEVRQLNSPQAASPRPAKPKARRPRTAAEVAVPASNAPLTEPGSGAANSEIAGRETEPIRAGEDTRRRGWFWHWNSIVTQFAPLIGLKGVGLLNSYTVWTDRRDESPHRGYAFPSQQTEASFYGEDRAELIALNKILVALDLIEIRKEMVTRVDEQGRRWKVPHNLYRVKDHGDDYQLSSRDVLKVIELAEKDRVIYRTIRHIFSDRFAPIDSRNVWWSILDELKDHPQWLKLAARAERDGRKASERTRAGHASRKGVFYLPTDGDTASGDQSSSDSATVTTSAGVETSVAPSNNGSGSGVEPGNKGSKPKRASSVAPVNDAPSTSVDDGNTIKDQSSLTTTTTTGSNSIRTEAVPSGAGPDVPSVIDVTARQTVTSSGPAGRPAPDDAPGEAAAFRAFEEANGRAISRAEQRLLREIAERAEVVTGTYGGDGTSGWSWVSAAIYEAVEAGSSFVAPRRVREIVGRWSREGGPGVGKGGDRAPLAQPAPAAPGAPVSSGPDFALPNGRGSRQTWTAVTERIAAGLERTMAADLFEGTALIRFQDGLATIAVATERQADHLSGGYRGLVERGLEAALGQPVTIAVIGPDRGDEARQSVEEAPMEEPAEPLAFIVSGSGLSGDQIWSALLDELTASGEVLPSNVSTWLRPARLVAEREDGTLVIGAPHAPAQRRIAGHFQTPIESALSRLLGRPVRIDVVA
ncbi:MAG: hypothetical protein IT334_10365 [Thermomicrobiales bacterium]|nr:hypothetical protein [Thermomicrobiales bacterium]